MKTKAFFLILTVIAASVVACKDDDDEPRKGDPDLTHEGEQWDIASLEYDLVDQSFGTGGIGVVAKSGTVEHAGTFYFRDNGEGSFEMIVEGYNKEDVFAYTIEENAISILNVEQQVGTGVDQNVLQISGSVVSDSERTLTGTIVKQSSGGGQFVLNFDIELKKK